MTLTPHFARDTYFQTPTTIANPHHITLSLNSNEINLWILHNFIFEIGINYTGFANTNNILLIFQKITDGVIYSETYFILDLILITKLLSLF